jgi:hypothetical protein
MRGQRRGSLSTIELEGDQKRDCCEIDGALQYRYYTFPFTVLYDIHPIGARSGKLVRDGGQGWYASGLGFSYGMVRYGRE